MPASTSPRPAHLSSASDDWPTPQDFFDALDAEFGFVLDVCASSANHKTTTFYALDHPDADRRDGLAQDWAGQAVALAGPVWMNPPYGRPIRDWMTKAFQTAQAGATVVALVPVRADTAWWHDLVLATGAQVRYVRGRLTFGDAVNTAAFSSAVVVYSPTDKVGGPGPVRTTPAHPLATPHPMPATTTAVAAPIARYAPTCLPPARWAQCADTARAAAAVAATRPATAVAARMALAHLSQFLSTPCGWTGTNPPDLAALLTGAAQPAPAPALPILKWVGGKTRLLPQLAELYGGQARIVEPFFGGGALSFHLASSFGPGLEVYANDYLEPLMEIYAAVRADVEGFTGAVEALAVPYLALEGLELRRQHYYEVRERYMKRELDGPVPLFVMLWCSYSGMYRIGKTYPGRFNSPHGFGREKPGFYQPGRLRVAAELMRGWHLSSGDFARCIDDVTADSFVLLDPPYRETYEGYTGEGFSAGDQLRVVAFFKEADRRGAKVVYTNKDLGDDYYERHFRGFNIQRVPIRYQVNRNCATVGRPVSYEVMISNGTAPGLRD